MIKGRDRAPGIAVEHPERGNRGRKKIGMRMTLGLVGAAVLVGLTAVTIAYLRDVTRAYERIEGKSAVISSAYGDIEFTQGGSGPHVLMIHGSGGGYDQGELLVEALLDDDFHWIAPSRFGYLRSTFRQGATFDDQAHAYAHLLDRLGVEKVAVVTMSHGGPSALLFAALHPERVSSLTLLSAGVAASVAENQAQANRKGDMLVKIYEHDALYWAATTLFKKQFMRLMGANDAVIANLTLRQREQTERLIDYMNPASPRSAGAAFDNKAAMPNERIAGIRAPTLVVHARDDALQLFHNAEYAATRIRGARLLSYEKGGHLVVMVEHAAIRAAVQKHVREHFR